MPTPVKPDINILQLPAYSTFNANIMPKYLRPPTKSEEPYHVERGDLIEIKVPRLAAYWAKHLQMFLDAFRNGRIDFAYIEEFKLFQNIRVLFLGYLPLEGTPVPKDNGIYKTNISIAFLHGENVCWTWASSYHPFQQIFRHLTPLTFTDEQMQTLK